MLIRRNTQPLYYLSSLKDMDGKIINPSVPHSELSMKGLEDKKVRRISLFKSVALGLMARGFTTEGETLTVYQAFPVTRDDLITPDTIQSPFSEFTKEIWCLCPITLKKIGEIKVGKVREEKKIPIGPRGAIYTLKRWSWKDLRPEWEQKKNKLI